jgi:hypothetical protein
MPGPTGLALSGLRLYLYLRGDAIDEQLLVLLGRIEVSASLLVHFNYCGR